MANRLLDLLEAVRVVHPTVRWYKFICLSHNAPRRAFIQWLTFQSRLSSRDRLAEWRLVAESWCPQCNADVEFHNHLFFDSAFSSQVWQTFSEEYENC